MRRTVAAAAAVLGMLPALAGCSLIDRAINPVFGDPSAAQDPPTLPHRAWHERLFVADLHVDTLLWERDFVERSSLGHVDLPRLREGGVDLQVFTIVTKTPGERDLPGGLHCIPGDGVNFSAVLSAIQLQPIENWFDLRGRIKHQVKRLEEAVVRSQARAAAGHLPELMLIKTGEDLKRLTEATVRGEALVGAVLGIEGVHWLEDPNDESAAAAAAEWLFKLGIRQVAPTHRFHNTLSGASEGCGPDEGLTPAGRAFLKRAEGLGMVVDLAHASHKTLLQALAGTSPLLSKPVVISHTGVQGACDETKDCYPHRNLTDDEIRAVASNGGAIGIGYWPAAVGRGYDHIVTAMAHARTVLSGAGYDPIAHLAFGSDFDGAVEVPFDATGLPVLTWRLLKAQFTHEQLRRIAGANACRIFAARLEAQSTTDRNAICPP